MKGHAAVVKLLLDNDADVRARNKRMETCLHVSVKNYTGRSGNNVRDEDDDDDDNTYDRHNQNNGLNCIVVLRLLLAKDLSLVHALDADGAAPLDIFKEKLKWIRLGENFSAQQQQQLLADANDTAIYEAHIIHVLEEAARYASRKRSDYALLFSALLVSWSALSLITWLRFR